MPDLQPGTNHEARAAIILPSGKGLNVSRTAHDLGCQVLATGITAGLCGQMIRALLDRYGIDDRFFHLPEGESRTGTILVDPTHDQTTVIHDAGADVPATMWPAVRRHVSQAVEGYPWVALCGSCPPELPKSAYAELVRDLQARGQRVGVDARDEWLAAALAAGPDLIKCNDQEASLVSGTPIETIEQAGDIARRWAKAGSNRVVITLGSRGAVAAQGEKAWYAAAPAVRPLSPIGSGDAMMAALMVGLARGDPLPETLRYGVAIGTANTLRLGSGCCDWDAVPALLRNTKVQEIGGPGR